MTKAAVYHFTTGHDERPKTYRDQLKTLVAYANSLGFESVDVFCDFSLNRFERTELDRFLSESDQYDALVLKDFYHLAKNTGSFFSLLKKLSTSETQVFSIEDGSFAWAPPPIDSPIRVATYSSHFGTTRNGGRIINVTNDRLALFVRLKTKWTLADQYADEGLRQTDGEQQSLKELISNKSAYDLLLVDTLSDLHWRTAKFCKLRSQLNLDIYSLQEGLLKRKE